VVSAAALAAGALVAVAPVASAAVPQDNFESVNPVRVLDTRFGTGLAGGVPAALGPGGSVTLQVAGFNGVPVGTDAVVVTITAIQPTKRTFVSVLPGDATGVPTTSNVNLDAGKVVAGEATVPLDATGSLKVYNSTGTINVALDLLGWYGAGATQQFAALQGYPVRVHDSTAAPVTAGHPVPISVAAAGVPADATAVVVNVTAVAPSAAGYISVLPHTDPPATPVSSVNFVAGQTVASLVTVKLGAQPAPVVLSTFRGAVTILVDVLGWYSPTAGSVFTPVTPVRLLDTRTHLGEAPGQLGRLGPGGAVDVQVTGVAGMPANATGAVFTVTAVGANTSGFIQAYPTPPLGTPGFPLTSTINTVPGAVIANHDVGGIGQGGRIRIRNKSGDVDALLDLVGYFTSAAGVDHGTAPPAPSVQGVTIVARVGEFHPRIRSQLPMYATTVPGATVSFKVYFPTGAVGYVTGPADSLGHAQTLVYVRPDSLGHLVKVVTTARSSALGAQASTVIQFAPVP
jgi:hypothetical protein